MPVVKVRPMRVGVNDRLMAVPVRMPTSFRAERMFVSVVTVVVAVAVLVL